MAQLNLSVPEPLSPAQEVVPRPKDVEEWITELPVVSVTKTAKLLHKLIKKLNRMKIDPSTRLMLMTPLIQPIDQNARALEKHYIDAVLPLPVKLKHSAFIRTQFAEELSYSYKLIIQNLIPDFSSQFERKLLAIAIFHALHRLSEIIYTKTLTYESPPNLVWNELHTLFKFAEINNFITMNIRASLGPNGEEVECTIKDLYLRILIFAIANPTRLRQRDICAVYLSIMRWTKTIRMRSIIEFTPSDMCFIVQTHGDYSPQHSTLISRQLQEPAIELDTGFLVQVLQDLHDSMPMEISGIVRGDKRDALTRSTLRQLIQSLGSTPQRHFTRTRLNFELPLAIGLNAIYELLTGHSISQWESTAFTIERSLDNVDIPNLDQGSDFKSLNMSDTLNISCNSELTLVEDENFDAIQLRSVNLSHTNYNSLIEKSKTSVPVSHSPYITLTTLNESVGGYCVDWGNKTPGAKIGELVGIQVPDHTDTCTLAVVRWIHDASKHGIQVGLQVLAYNVKAVIINNIAGNSNPIYCLLISEFKAANLPASLIAPPLALRTDNLNTTLLLKQEKIERKIRLVELLEASGAFARFSFIFQ